MKYCRYKLNLYGQDKEAIILLSKRLPKQWGSLGKAREAGRAVKVLFALDYECVRLRVNQSVQKLETL